MGVFETISPLRFFFFKMHFASQCPVAQKWVDIPLQKEQLELFLDQKTKIETRDSSSYRIQIKFNSGEEVTIVSLEQSFIRSFTAFESICPHSGGPLYRGIIQDIEDSAAASSNGGGGGGGCSSSAFHGSVVLCPWHEYGFDISSTGEGIENEFNIRIFKVELVEDSSSPLKIKILVPDSSTSIIDSATVFSGMYVYI